MTVNAGYTFPDSERLVARFQQVTVGPTLRLQDWFQWGIYPNPLFGPVSTAGFLVDGNGDLILDGFGNPIPL